MPVVMFMLTPRASFKSDWFMVTKEEEPGDCECIQFSGFLLSLFPPLMCIILLHVCTLRKMNVATLREFISLTACYSNIINLEP